MKKRRRAPLLLGLGFGYAILAAGTAFGVIEDKSPAPVDVTAVNASAYAAQPGSAANSHPKPHSSPSASAAATSAAPSVAPSPVDTVTGSVHDGVHRGDLRYFLVPPPDGPSSVQGNPDGNTDDLDYVVNQFYNSSSTVRTYLQQDGFKTGCDRTYQDTTMGANVQIELIQFGSSGEASQWMSGFSLDGGGFQRISVSGESGAEGWSYTKNGSYSLIGAYTEGDTFYQVSIFSGQSIPASDLGQVITAEHERLAHG